MADDEEIRKSIPIMQLLSEPVKKRVNALKKLQLESLNYEAAFFAEVFQLECNYHKYFKELYEKREKIVSGAVEPTDEEADFKIPGAEDEHDSDNDELIKELKEKLAVSKPGQEAPGIPEFWLTIFKNVELLNEMIQPHDEPILKYLSDVQVVIPVGKMGFSLKFIFAPNPFFSNTCLTKDYEMKCKPEENDPWSFEGPEIFQCKGCTIDWNKNKNVTVKTIRKRQRHKSEGSVRTVVKSITNDSFFNFFNPPLVPEGEEMDNEIQAILTCDFEIGHYIRDKIIPRAVLYYTGEALEDEFDDAEESDEDFENDEEEEDEDNDEESEEGSEPEVPTKNENTESHGRNKNKNKKNKNKNNQQQQDCAQQ